MDQERSNRGIGARIKGMFTRKNSSNSIQYDGSSTRRYFEGSRRHYDGSYSGRFGDRSTGRDSSTRSVMFDLELSHRGLRVSTELPSEAAEAVGSVAAAAVAAGYGPAIHRLRNLAKPLSSFEMDLLQDVQALAETLRDTNDGNVPIDELASDLTAMGYECAIQCVESHGMGDTPANYGSVNPDTKCLELLRHEFILCAGMSDGSVEHSCVVDPSFRDQFSLGKQNDGYEKLLLAVPEEFVGSPIRLQALVTVICSEMVKVYQDLGVSLPPWRRPRSVLGKWFDVEADGNADASFGVGPMVGMATMEHAGSGTKSSGSNCPANHSDKSRKSDRGFISRIFGSSKMSSDEEEAAAVIASEKSNKPKRIDRNVGRSVSLLAQKLASSVTIDLNDD